MSKRQLNKRPPIPQQTKDLVLQRAENKCEKCGHSLDDGQYHFHHLNYLRVGNENADDLQILCVCCHQIEHPDKRIEPTNIKKARRERKVKRQFYAEQKNNKEAKQRKISKRWIGEVKTLERRKRPIV
jgi:5-methylcytosine-specific restriction endonuclease McrA